MRQTVKRVFNQEKRSGAQNKVPELCAADIRATQRRRIINCLEEIAGSGLFEDLYI
jgi:hypothetical protein